MQTVPYILGIAHPSGFPAYVLLGWLWSHAIPFGDPAYRMNLFSAVGMATAALALAGIVMELGVEPVFAAGAALVFGLTRVPWEHATHADVHALALAAASLSYWAALRWKRTGAVAALAACAFATGAALAIHSGMILLVPGIVLAACSRRPQLRPALVCVALGFAVVFAAYAYLPIRSSAVFEQRRDPTLALGLPPGRPFWDADHPSTWTGFQAEIGGGEFNATGALQRLIAPATLRKLPARYGEAAVGDLAGGILLIALIGIIAVVRKAPFAGVGILTGTLLPVLFVSAYPAESDPERYFLPSYWAIGVFLGAGADVLARGGLARPPRAIVAVVAALFVFVAAGNVYADRAAFAATRDRSAQHFIERIVRETPNRAILVAPWMYATPLAYAAYVEKRLGDRIVVTGWPEDYNAYYAGWIVRRPITFVTDDAVVSVKGLRFDRYDSVTPAPHLFAARALQ